MSIANAFLLPFVYSRINGLIYYSLNSNKETKLKIIIVHDSDKWVNLNVGYTEMNLKDIRSKTINGEGMCLIR